MQDLMGNLSIFEPISVLQMLNLAQASGELQLTAEDNGASIYFERGSVTFAAVRNRPIKLGEILLREKRITQKTLDRMLKKKREGMKLGVQLLEEGIIKESELRGAIEEQIKEVIYEVIRWRLGTFVFEGGKRPRAQDILIDIPLDRLMLEGLKRMDEEKEQI